MLEVSADLSMNFSETAPILLYKRSKSKRINWIPYDCPKANRKQEVPVCIVTTLSFGEEELPTNPYENRHVVMPRSRAKMPTNLAMSTCVYNTQAYKVGRLLRLAVPMKLTTVSSGLPSNLPLLRRGEGGQRCSESHTPWLVELFLVLVVP